MNTKIKYSNHNKTRVFAMEIRANAAALLIVRTIRRATLERIKSPDLCPHRLTKKIAALIVTPRLFLNRMATTSNTENHKTKTLSKKYTAFGLNC